MAADRRSKRTPPEIEINRDWCKACGICIEFCPRDVFEADEEGKPVVVDGEACIACEQCEIRCPDFAVRLKDENNE